VDEVIFDVDSSKLAALEEVFLQCDEEGVRTRVAIDFSPHVNSDITLDRVAGAPLLTFSAAPLDDLRLVLKRIFDLTVAACGLILFSPLFAGVAILIKLTSPGPIIFRQARNCFQAGARPAHHAAGPLAAQILYRRAAATVQCAARRYVDCRTAPASA
jgi:hypothetical protein